MSRRAVALDAQQLALFEAPVAVTAPSAVAPAVAAAPGASGRASAEPLAAPLPIASGLPPAFFRHPNAEREIRLEGHLVGYALKRARRRSIGFIVGAEGLSVNAPKWVGLQDIDAALQEKSRWILKKLQEQQERAQRLQAARVEWRDGASLPFLGQPLTVVLDSRATGAVLSADMDSADRDTADMDSADSGADATPAVPASAPRMTLRVGLPNSATPAQIRDIVQSWLQRQARRIFEERCKHFELKLNVRVTKLSLSSAQTRWGSASADGAIRLNWRLVHFAMPSIDYVVAHELAHLREMNHSPRFWDVVRSVLPDYEEARWGLKDGLVPQLD